MGALRYLLLGSILLFGGTATAQTPLDLFPQDAVVSIGINDLDDLMKKGDKFLAEAEIRMPIRPSELFDQGTGFLGVRKGYDRKAPAIVTLMPPERKEDTNGWRWIETGLVPVIPFTDADVMASNFGIGKGKLKPMTITAPDANHDFVKHLMRSDKHVYLSTSEKTLQRVMKSKTVASGLTPAQRAPFEKSDVLLHFGSYLWQQDNFYRPDAFARALAGEDAKEKEFAEQLAAGVKEVQNVVLGFRLRDGIDGHLLVTVPKEGKAAKLLGSVRSKNKPSNLRGLPDGNLLFAQASAGKAEHQTMLTKALFNIFLEDLLINQRIIDQVDRLTYLGVFQEVTRHLQGNRLAVYQNLDEKKHGLFCAVAVLDTDDARQFVQIMRVLAKMATADTLDLSKAEVKEEIDIGRLVRDLGSTVYPVRQSANTKLLLIGEPALPYLAKAIESEDVNLEGKRRARDLRDRISAVAAQRRKELLDAKNRPLFDRPTMTFIANVEKRQDVSVDVINLKVAGADKAVLGRLAQMLGPDWDKIRLGIVGNQIVLLLGSDVSLFESTLRNLQKDDPGLAGSKRLAGFHEHAAKDRQFEFHVSIDGVLRLVSANAKLDTPTQLTSMALTIGPQSLQLDARVPMAEVRVIARKAQEGIPQ
jgi:hypothetical protein